MIDWILSSMFIIDIRDEEIQRATGMTLLGDSEDGRRAKEDPGKHPIEMSLLSEH